MCYMVQPGKEKGGGMTRGLDKHCFPKKETYEYECFHIYLKKGNIFLQYEWSTGT